MISIESTEVTVNPNTFTPQMKFSFTVNLTIVDSESKEKTEEDLAYAIGKEVLKQAHVYHALTKKD